MRRTPITFLALVLVIIAGCTGSPTSGIGTDAPGTTVSTDTGQTDAGTATTAPADDTEIGGVVNFYVSDEPNAIGDFAHLNVTISKIGFARSGGDGAGADAGNESNETAEASAGGWIERDVDNRTVDLTRLLGANASFVGSYDVPEGSYTKTFAYVSAVEATLTTGETVRVKLPSEKLQLNSKFTVGPNSSVDFVFDIAVHEAGKSGKYVLKPVISQSGANQPIEAIDGPETDREREQNEEREQDEERDQNRERDQNETADEPSLNATFVGTVTPGENATLQVTQSGSPVANASVSVDGEVVGTTGAGGTLTVAIPDAENVIVVVIVGEAETELEVTFEDGT